MFRPIVTSRWNPFVLHRILIVSICLSRFMDEWSANAFLVPGFASPSRMVCDVTNRIQYCHHTNLLALSMSDGNNNNEEQSDPIPQTFREAEVLGLKYMQERKFKEALDGM